MSKKARNRSLSLTQRSWHFGVARYNQTRVDGLDTDFYKDPDHLIPVETAPFYCQAADYHNPRLYNGGSMVGDLGPDAIGAGAPPAPTRPLPWYYHYLAPMRASARLPTPARRAARHARYITASATVVREMRSWLVFAIMAREACASSSYQTTLVATSEEAGWV